MGAAAKSVEDYVSACPPEAQDKLRNVLSLVRQTAPEAVQTISYKMPTFKLGSHTLHVGAFKSHIGLFPPVRIAGLEERLRRYRGPKGNLKFPLDEPMPYDLIAEIVDTYRGGKEE